MADTRVQQLQIDLHTHFSRLMLELEAMPPAMSNLGTIPGHIQGMQLTGSELIAHALGWTKLGSQWCELASSKNTKQKFFAPKEGFSWDNVHPLILWMYAQGRALDCKRLCKQLQSAYQELVDRVSRVETNEWRRLVTSNGKSLETLLYEHIITLYKDELLRLRYWKKGLGWI